MQDEQQSEDTQAAQTASQAGDALCAAAQDNCTQAIEPEACRELVAACAPGDFPCHETALAAFGAAPAADGRDPDGAAAVYGSMAWLLMEG